LNGAGDYRGNDRGSVVGTVTVTATEADDGLKAGTAAVGDPDGVGADTQAAAVHGEGRRGGPARASQRRRPREVLPSNKEICPEGRRRRSPRKGLDRAVITGVVNVGLMDARLGGGGRGGAGDGRASGEQRLTDTRPRGSPETTCAAVSWSARMGPMLPLSRSWLPPSALEWTPRRCRREAGERRLQRGGRPG